VDGGVEPCDFVELLTPLFFVGGEEELLPLASGLLLVVAIFETGSDVREL
jgi:hypothetical protein